jgi:hypothetical protein
MDFYTEADILGAGSGFLWSFLCRAAAEAGYHQGEAQVSERNRNSVDVLLPANTVGIGGMLIDTGFRCYMGAKRNIQIPTSARLQGRIY